ncbi:V-type ATP synthase subunit I domain-containing protein [Paracoccus binzhouensis]|uniref:hypothetical protein n=1 Tax=Paracoccus binzhouensis TaxID=2796149 RepID=UPI0018EF031E|nr:hypothetical protein [Paracoccus binzhouensis]
MFAKATAILRHSRRQVTGNLAASARIAGPRVLGAVLVILCSAMAMVAWPAAFPLGLLGMVLALALLFSVAVHWHRYVLLNETGPERDWDRVAAYFGWWVAISFLGGLAALPLQLVLPAARGGWIELLIGILALWIGLRLSPKLVAAALGRQLGLRDAWRATGQENGVVEAVTAMMGGLFIILGGLAAVTEGLRTEDAPQYVASAALVLAYLGLALFNLSVITTLYGHYVEGRPLR